MSLQDEISLLRRELAEAERLDAGKIEASLAQTGFTCARCAQCCRGAGGDNTVALFPGEVRLIGEATGLAWQDVAVPPESGDYDSEGRRHAFEWVLKKRPDGDCIFLEGNSCSIYYVRPHICRTYPFSFDGHQLQVYECTGLRIGYATSPATLAENLRERHISELRETILLLEKFEPFEPGPPSGGDLVVVHDSEGTRMVRHVTGSEYEDVIQDRCTLQ